MIIIQTLAISVVVGLIALVVIVGVYRIMERNARTGLYAIIAVVVFLLVVQVGAAMAFIAGRP